MSSSTTFPPTEPPKSGDPRILTRRRAPGRAIRLVALSATVVAVAPGAAWGIEGDLRVTGWAAGSVRFEPVDPAGGLTVSGSGSYRGVIEVRRNGGGLAVRNDLALEEYVRGIDEVPPSWPAAALQAQAIAARTYAAHKVRNGDDRWRAVGADICATPTCQVYRGLDAENAAAGHGWLPAVKATAGRALLEGGQPILASYSATANGPRAMSQNGALEMATAGRSATEILQSFYGLPPTLAPGRLPATIKVALVMSAKSVRVSSAAGFRMVDGNGAELAVAPAGEWSVAVAGDGVRVVPPDSYRPEPVPLPALVTESAVAVLRRPGRVVTAAATSPLPSPWAVGAAALLAAGAGAATVTFGRRRRA